MKVSASKSATSPSCKTLAVMLLQNVEKNINLKQKKYGNNRRC